MFSRLSPSDRRGRHSIAAVRSLAAALILAGSWAVSLGWSSGPATAATLAGTATITNPVDSKALPSGGSATTFTVALPQGAACSGDTANDGYHVYSYLVPKGTDLTAVTFVNSPSTGYGLVDNTGTYYGAANTAINTGQIIAIPNNFRWGPLVSTGGGAVALSDLLAGGSSAVWETGLACANTTGALTDYWNTEITFAAAALDNGGFTWTAVPGASTGGTTTTAPAGSTTTVDGATTTTADPGTTTTDPATTTTTTATDPTSTTTTVDPSSTTTVDTAWTPGGGASGNGTSTSGGELPRTGSPVVRDLAIGLLFLGSGFFLVGLSVKWQYARLGEPEGLLP